MLTLSQRNAGDTILISQEVDVRAKTVTRGKGGNVTMTRNKFI